MGHADAGQSQAIASGNRRGGEGRPAPPPRTRRNFFLVAGPRGASGEQPGGEKYRGRRRRRRRRRTRKDAEKDARAARERGEKRGQRRGGTQRAGSGLSRRTPGQFHQGRDRGAWGRRADAAAADRQPRSGLGDARSSTSTGARGGALSRARTTFSFAKSPHRGSRAGRGVAPRKPNRRRRARRPRRRSRATSPPGSSRSAPRSWRSCASATTRARPPAWRR